LFFTLAENILPAYVLPGIPAAVLLLTTLWTDAWEMPGRQVRAAVGVSAVSVIPLTLSLTMLFVTSPELLKLKSQKTLVDVTYTIDPDIRFFYFPSRVFSAGFYSKGSARVASYRRTLLELAGNSSRDAVAVRLDNQTDAAQALGATFSKAEAFGRYALFIERPLSEQ
jgi:hypothetical protein